MIILNEKVQAALELTLKKHHNQKRKLSKAPYSVHPISTAILLIESKECENVIVSALLHDSIEDTDTSYDEIMETFGSEVVRIVKACTEPDKNRSWEERKNHTIQHFNEHLRDEQIVILADKLHNLYSIKQSLEIYGDVTWTHFSRAYKDQKWYYGSLKSAFEHSVHVRDSALLNLFVNLYDAVFENKNSWGNNE